MRLVKELLNGVFVLVSPRYLDNRGSFAVTFEVDAAAELGIPGHFVQDNLSLSCEAETIRGIHLQLPPHAQGKLVRVQRGSIADVVVDLRAGSPTFGQHELIELTAESGEQVWIPPGFGHAFCTLQPDTEVFYKVDAPYAPAAERTLAWNDPSLSVVWPLSGDPVLSDKDAAGLSFDEVVAAMAASIDRPGSE